MLANALRLFSWLRKVGPWLELRSSRAETGRIFATSNVVVRYWIARFNAEGPVGLFDRFRSGRPRKATPEVVSAIDKIIREDPKEVGQLATFWTVAMMALALVGRLGLKISPSTVRTTFRPAGASLPPWMGLRFGRPPAGTQREVSREAPAMDGFALRPTSGGSSAGGIPLGSRQVGDAAQARP